MKRELFSAEDIAAVLAAQYYLLDQRAVQTPYDQGGKATLLALAVALNVPPAAVLHAAETTRALTDTRS